VEGLVEEWFATTTRRLNEYAEERAASRTHISGAAPANPMGEPS